MLIALYVPDRLPMGYNRESLLLSQSHSIIDRPPLELTLRLRLCMRRYPFLHARMVERANRD